MFCHMNLLSPVPFSALRTKKEMDYRSEARNGQKFRELYGSLQDVVVPSMYMDLCTRQVLTMEWIEGQKLSEVKDLYLIEVGVYSSLTQLLEYGFYHADPHPGNLLRTSEGKLAYLGVFQNAVSKGVQNISFGDLSGNLGRTMYKFKFQIPSYFSLVIRSLAVLEGVALSFDPNYKVLSSAYPWIARKVLTAASPNIRSTLQTLLYKDGTFRIDRLDSLLSESLRTRTGFRRNDTEEAGRDSRMAAKQLLYFTLSEKGEFLRDILLTEITKTHANGVIDIDAETRTPEEEALLVLYQLNRLQDLLPSTFAVLSEISPEARQEVLLMPADITGRLTSRIIARTIRRIIV